jgi:putative endonuclease
MIRHNDGRNTSTKAGVPWELKYSEIFDSRAEAMNRESEIKKKKRRTYIEWLISSKSDHPVEC